MRPTEIKPGLWRWTAPHPDWQAGATPGSSAAWPREVGCVLYQSTEAAVFIDALVPKAGEDDFWRWADVHCHGREVHVLTTIAFHKRSRDALVERYDARTSSARASPLAGMQSIPLRGAGETLFWLAEARTLVPGDRLISSPTGTLSMCPQSWLDYLPGPIGVERLRELLTALLDLPIETILTSHGEPVLEGGRAALARALARPAPNRAKALPAKS